MFHINDAAKLQKKNDIHKSVCYFSAFFVIFFAILSLFVVYMQPFFHAHFYIFLHLCNCPIVLYTMYIIQNVLNSKI